MVLEPVYLWSYRDRDNKICWLEGECSPVQATIPEAIKINFSDEQMMKLDVAIDAQQFTVSEKFSTFLPPEEKFNTLWQLGWQAHQQNFSGDLASGLKATLRNETSSLLIINR